MARMPRLVIPDYPHHVTQRGTRRMQTFFCNDDYRYYLALLSQARAKAGVAIWAYCLMPNHVHLVAVPAQQNSLARLFRFVHGHYSRYVNSREHWQGHLWQERFHSFVMDEHYLWAAVRYTELNPVRAHLCVEPHEWPWSSARAHLSGADDAVVSVQPMLQRAKDWSRYLSQSANSGEVTGIRRYSRTGRPAGDTAFLERLEALTGLSLRKMQSGRRPAVT